MLTNNKWSSWIGYGLSGLVILFMLFDGSIKLVPLDIVITATAELGYPASVDLLAASASWVSSVRRYTPTRERPYWARSC